MTAVKRLLSPATNMPGLTAALLAAWTAANMIWNVVHHSGAWNEQEAVAALAAVVAWVTRGQVTPVADPRDGNGRPLTPFGARPGLILSQDELAAIRKILATASVAPPAVQPPGTGTGPAGPGAP